MKVQRRSYARGLVGQWGQKRKGKEVQKRKGEKAWTFKSTETSLTEVQKMRERGHTFIYSCSCAAVQERRHVGSVAFEARLCAHARAKLQPNNFHVSGR